MTEDNLDLNHLNNWSLTQTASYNNRMTRDKPDTVLENIQLGQNSDSDSSRETTPATNKKRPPRVSIGIDTTHNLQNDLNSECSSPHNEPNSIPTKNNANFRDIIAQEISKYLQQQDTNQTDGIRTPNNYHNHSSQSTPNYPEFSYPKRSETNGTNSINHNTLHRSSDHNTNDIQSQSDSSTRRHNNINNLTQPINNTLTGTQEGHTLIDTVIEGSISHNVNSVVNTFRREDYTPKDKRLLPISNILASQLKPIRASIEKISIVNLADTSEVSKKTKVVALWAKKRAETTEDNEEERLDIDDEQLLPNPNIYVPKSLQLKRFNLNIPQYLRECEYSKDKIETLTNNFIKTKNRFIETCSSYAEEVATLNRDFAITQRGKNLIKGFITLTHYLVTHLKQTNIQNQSNTIQKPNELLATCIFIHFINNLDSEYFTWLQIPRNKFLNLVIKHVGDHHENVGQFTQNPIVGQSEILLFQKIADLMLIPVFVNVTKNLAELHIKRRLEIEEQKKLAKIIQVKETDKITQATKSALEDIELDDQGTKIIQHLNACAAKIEDKLTKKFQSKKVIPSSSPSSKKAKSTTKNNPSGAQKKTRVRVSFTKNTRSILKKSKYPQPKSKQKTQSLRKTNSSERKREFQGGKNSGAKREKRRKQY